MIYAVEDNPFDQRILDYLLGDLPRQWFGSAEDMLAAYAEERPAMVLTDQRLPGMTGLDAIRQIRAAGPPHPRLIVLCNPTQHGFRGEAEAAGADLVLAKPNDLDEARSVVATIKTELEAVA